MVTVIGDLGEVQSCIDFYLRATSMDEVLDSRTMRDRFFAIFKQEDEYRKENFLVYQEDIIGGNNDYELKSSPVLMGSEVEFNSGEELIWGSLETKNEVSSSVSGGLEMENKNSEVENAIGFTVGSSSETEKSELEEEKHPVSTKNIGFMWGVRSSSVEDDDDFIEPEYDEVGFENTKEVEDDEEDSWVNWGSGESDEDFEEDSGDDSEDESDDDDDTWDNWGSDDEDEESGDSDSVEGVSNEDDEFNEEDDIWGNWNSDDEEDGEDDTKTIEAVPDVEDSLSSKGYAPEENSIDDLVSDLGLDLDVFDSSIDVDFPIKEEVPKNKVLDSVSKKMEEPVTDVPTDLREFVSKYQGCEVSFARKYFSSKEIDRQLNLSRIYKRKNRLYI